MTSSGGDGRSGHVRFVGGPAVLGFCADITKGDFRTFGAGQWIEHDVMVGPEGLEPPTSTV